VESKTHNHFNRTLESTERHLDVVTCVAISKSGGVCVTGSRDTTLKIWSIDYEKFHSNSRMASPLTCLGTINGHDDDILFVAVNEDEDLILSGSRDGTAVLYRLRSLQYLRSLQHKYSVLFGIISARYGVVVTYSDDRRLCVHSYNGELLSYVNVHAKVSSLSH
jgi:WD40 repeat protein